VAPNEEIAFKGIGASFTAVGICSGLLILLLMVVAAIVGGRLVKPRNPLS